MPKKPTLSLPLPPMHDLHIVKKRGPMMAELYRRAEAHLRDQRKRKGKSRAGATESDGGPERLMHELEVHQIELELQNAELQKARDELEVALEKYTDLYDFAPVGYFSLDESAAILESNLTGAALLGLERARLVNRRLLVFVAPKSRPVFLAFLEKVFTGTKDQTCEAQLLKEGGDTFWASFRATSAISHKGARKWCRVAFGDISDRRRAEEAHARIAAIVESSEDAIFSKDLNNLITSWNAGAERLFGYTAREAIGRPATMLIPRNRIDEAPDILGRIRRGERVKNYETVRRRKDGKLLDVSLTVSPIMDSQGQTIGTSKIAHDISERKRVEGNQRRLEILTASNLKLEAEITRRRAVEQALKQSEQHQIEMLEQSHHMQAQLRHLSRQVLQAQEEERKRISRELHDVIAQTLTGINIRLADLKKAAGYNTKGLGRKIARTQQLVEHSVSIVHRFARELRPAALDDLGLVPALHTFMKGFKSDTGIQVSLSADGAAEQVNGDQRTVLYRVAQEALHNVARHAHAGHAHVIIQKQAGAVCLKIEDDGEGFQTERVAHIRKDRRLGLLGMRERVEMVNGRFRIESTPGKGTTIIAEVPLAARGGGGAGLAGDIRRTKTKT